MRIVAGKSNKKIGVNLRLRLLSERAVRGGKKNTAKKSNKRKNKKNIRVSEEALIPCESLFFIHLNNNLYKTALYIYTLGSNKLLNLRNLFPL